jgi:hypothetical protein
MTLVLSGPTLSGYLRGHIRLPSIIVKVVEPTSAPQAYTKLVSQATKNLGYLTASTAELDSRAAKWNDVWNGRPIPRLQKGDDVRGLVEAFVRAAAAPLAIRRVTIVTSSLSKSAVAEAFKKINEQTARPEVLHVLWLLSGFVDQCKAVGAIPEIICRP